MPIKDNIRIIRELKNKTVPKLAKESGLSKTSIYAWESGEYEPGKDNLDILAKYLDVPIKDFYDDEKWNNKSDNSERLESKVIPNDNNEDIYRNIVEGNTEYILIPRSVLDGKYRLVPMEELKQHQINLDAKDETIDRLLGLIETLNGKNTKPEKVEKVK